MPPARVFRSPQLSEHLPLKPEKSLPDDIDLLSNEDNSNYSKAFLYSAKEYPELKSLRDAAVQKEQAKLIARNKAKKWKKLDILRLVLWKNLTIRKRRKTQFILLLFQIFLWFGVACFSIVLRSTRLHYPEEPYADVTQLVPRVRTVDLATPIAISYYREQTNRTQSALENSTGPFLDIENSQITSLNKLPPIIALHSIPNNQTTQLINTTETNFSSKLLSTFQDNIAKVMQGVLDYYSLTYDGLHPPLRMFKNYDDMVEHLRLDHRIPFGIHFQSLDFEKGKIEYNLVFWEKEVPVGNDFNAFDCRSLMNVAQQQQTNCAMQLYGKHGFMFVQTAINSKIIELLAKNHGVLNKPLIEPILSSTQFMSNKQSNITMNHTSDPFDSNPMETIQNTSTGLSALKSIAAPNRFRLELPGLSIMAERYPEHDTVRSQAAESAAAAPFYFMLALVSVFSFVVMDMVSEKESKMKEIMKTYGLSSGMFWLSWLLTYALLNIIIVWCAVFICTIGGVFGPTTSILVVALLLYMYLLSLITFGFMVSVFFQKAQMASTAGMIFNLLLYGLGWVIHHTRLANYFIKGFFMLFSTITFSLSVIDLITLLPDGGVTIIDLFNFRDYSIGIHLLFLTFDTLLYFVLAWYLDQVVQPDWGSTKHWTFIFEYVWDHIRQCIQPANELSNEYGSLTADTMRLDLNDDIETGNLDSEWIEPVSQELKTKGTAVRLKNLVKRFPGKDGMKTVVDHLTLDIYGGEIFGLLGHNGAGKTTTISMLTGMLQIDDGDATILGHSVRHHGEKARQLISVCPQQNFFFDDLTCLEHLIFFAALRGIDVSDGLEQANSSAYFYDLIVQKRFLVEQRARIVDAFSGTDGLTEEMQRSGIIDMEKHFARFGLSLFTDPDVNYVHSGGRTVVSAKTWPGVLALIEKVGLSDKMFHTPRMLSGGMKRRLWLSISLIGDPKVVFLDEPTSGVDPLGRQELWRLIEDEKIAGRCIIVTTHHMEEADILADRKAIMTSGKLRCIGSSLFLKSRFGIGYYLEVETIINENSQTIADNTLLFLKQFVPDAKRHIDDNKGSAAAMAAAKRNLLLFSLPLSSVEKFSILFRELELQKKTLGIIEYGVSLSTLEEVFFKLGDDPIETQPEVEQLMNNQQLLLPETDHLETVVTRHRGSVFAADPLTAPTGKRAVDTMQIIPLDAAGTFKKKLKYGKRGDLVSQKFQKSRQATVFKFLRAVVSLRFLQISHNKTAFSVDVIFPVLMLLISLFFRDGGPGGLNFLLTRKGVDIPMDTYSGIFNQTIVYSIDSRLSGSGLADAYSILGHFPPSIKSLLRRVDIANIDDGFDGNDDYLDDDDDNENEELQKNANLSVKQITPETIDMCSAVKDTPVHGRAVRNYLFVKRDPKKVKFPPTISAGLSFEPRSSLARYKPGVNYNHKRYIIFFVQEGFWSDSYKLQIRIFYDAGLPHSLPSMMSLLTDTLLSSSIPNKTLEMNKHTTKTSTLINNVLSTSNELPFNHIKTTSRPLFIDVPVYVTAMTYGMYIMLSLGLSALPSRFGIQIMFDKFAGTKHAMIVMGLPFSLYWLGSFITNYLAMLLGNSIVTGFIACFIPIFRSFAIVPVLLCALFYSASVLLWAYFLSQLFYNLKAYAMTLQLTGMLLALCPAYLVSVFSDASASGAKWSYSTLLTHIISSFLFPPYNPIGVLIGCAIIITECHHTGHLPALSDYFALNRLPIWSVLASATQAIVLFSATVWIDRLHYHMKKSPEGAKEMLDIYEQRRLAKRNEWLQRCGGNQALIPASLQNHKDMDVQLEEFECMKLTRLLKGQERKYKNAKTIQDKESLSSLFEMASIQDPTFPDEMPLVLIDDLYYLFQPTSIQQPPHVAVRGFSLSIYRGEIFGLLGPNGAGKTTSINLLTCNYLITAPTRGVALLGGHDVSRDPSAAFSHLGLCPQFDALWTDITVRDNLKVFARIKNVPEDEIEYVIDNYIEDLELGSHQYKRVAECSGGNKRRVSVAVAFMGNPDVVLMDEPSSGIDPVGRRRLAELIHREAETRCVLITTHSMEEAEALCSRIGIIVNGELNCLNTSLAIRNQYGSGIRLEVIFDDASLHYTGFDPTGSTLNPWQQFLSDYISESTSEIHRVANRVTYDIPLQSNSLGHLFGLMEDHKHLYAVKDYALSQPTLEQVFITFAKRQKSAQESIQEIIKD